MKKYLFFLGLLFFLLISISSSAQDYAFYIPDLQADVYINKDASINIEYWITFNPVAGYHEIDIVDVGFPNDFYELNSVVAAIDGKDIHSSNIRKSEYIKTGVEIHLGSNSIKPGKSGTLWVYGRNPNMVYQDKEKDDYGSVEFVPTWYGSEFVRGTTKLKVSIHFPAGVQPDETVYHYYQFTEWSYDKDGRLTFTWIWYDAVMSNQYRVGVSFPQKYVDRIYKPSAMIYFMKFFMGLLGFIFNPCMIFIYIVVFIIVVSAWSNKTRMKKYLPPSLKVEGVGIKRGLTAVEAAILEEMPLNKVVSMIIYGLVKKKGLKIREFKPLHVEKMKIEYPWYDYEEEFFKAVKPDYSLDNNILKDLLVDLIKKVAKKIKGFNLSLTRKYYRSIVNNAWEIVRKANIPELQAESLNRNLEWLLLDNHFEDKFEHMPFNDVYLPAYWHTYMPYHHGQNMGNVIKMPSLDFANDFVKGFQVMSDNIVTNVQSLMSGVTKVTNPPPAPSSSGGSWSSGGGGGCACACACAGCACACAGGGR